MSNGPTCTGGSVKRLGGWVSLQITRDDWCTFKGKCNAEKVVNMQDLCLYCEYRKPLPIPDLINERKGK
jgi:hypothetical protein